MCSRSTKMALLLLLAAMPLGAYAQSLGSYVTPGNDPFTVSVTPDYPQPFSAVALSFVSNDLDLTNASLALSVNGKGTYEGNVRTISVPVGAAGTPVQITASVTTNGKTYRQNVSVIPEDVSLVLEPESSRPPLYPGKPLVPLGGRTRLVAVANLYTASGKRIDPSTISYLWTVDDTRIADSSGIGKSALLVASPLQYRDRTVSVVAQNQDGTVAGGASATLSPVTPSIRMYENDPLRGIRFERALSGNYNISSSELSLYAAPFSFPLISSAPSLTWYLNGDVAQRGPVVTLRPTGNGQGSAGVSVAASSPDTTETLVTSIGLTFGTKTSSIFGL